MKDFGRQKNLQKYKTFGNIKESYSYVPSLKAELVARNLGSHIDYQLEEDNAFLRMFVSLRAASVNFGSTWMSFDEQIFGDIVSSYCFRW